MNKPPLTNPEGEVRELTADDFALFRPIAGVDPDMAGIMQRMKNRGGRPKVEAPKANANFRMAPDLIEGIKATGKGYGVRVEHVLREALDAGKLDAMPSDLFDSGRGPAR